MNKLRTTSISKALVALLLAILMIVSCTSTSFAVVADDLADSGAEADIADSGADMDLAESGDNKSFTTNSYFYVKNQAIDGWSANMWIGSSGAEIKMLAGDATYSLSLYDGDAGNAAAVYRAKITASNPTYYGAYFHRWSGTDDWGTTHSNWFKTTSGNYMGATSSQSLAGNSDKDYTLSYYAPKVNTATLTIPGAVSGTGTSSNPYILVAGQTYTPSLYMETDDCGATGFLWQTSSTYSSSASTYHAATQSSANSKAYYTASLSTITPASANSSNTAVTYYTWCYQSARGTAHSTSSKSATVYYQVQAADAPAIDTFTIDDGASKTLKLGETATLATTTSHDTGYSIVYSSNSDKISITDNTVKALAPVSSATITASLVNDEDEDDVADTATVTVTVSTPTIGTYSYSTSSMLIGSSSSSPTKSLTSGTYNSSSTITWKYYLSSTGTTTDNTYVTINADTGVMTAKSTYAAVTSSAQNVYAVATVTYNGVSYTTARKSASYDVFAYFLMGLGDGWSGSEATMFTYDSSRSVWTNSRALTAKTYSGDTNGFKVVKRVKGTNTYYDYTSTITMTRSGNDNKTTALDSTSTGNFAITADVAGTYIFDLALTNNTTPSTLKPHYPQKVNYNKGGKTTTAFPTTPVYVTYNTAIGSAPATEPKATGWTFNNWVTTSGGSTNFNFSSTKITSETTIYAKWTEVTAGIALTAYTDGSASTTGGTIQISGSDVTSVSGVGIDTSKTIVAVAKSATGYLFAGWDTDGANKAHIKLYTNPACTTAYTPGSGNTTATTLYIKTDGTSNMTTANSIIKAMFVNGNRTITTGIMAATSNSGYTTANGSSVGATITGGGAKVVGNTVNLTANEPSGYKFVGWYSSAAAATSAAFNATLVSTNTSYSFTLQTTSNTYYYALYKKVYHISLYNTTEEVGGDFRYVTGPPMRVTVTPSGGTAVTYTYKKNASATSEGNTRTSGDYNEGDLLTVYAGDTVVLSYAALASSDTITGVFFNNARRYTCEGENDNLYKLREYKAAGWGTDGDDSWDYDYMAATTLYANQNYYEGATATTIAGQFANYQAKDGVDNNMHTVTFVAKSDYLNIDLEIATKRQFIFTDETGLDIRSEMMDNYYNPLSEVSASSATTKFGIKLATSDTCTYDWGTGAKVKFYRDAACTNEITGVFTVASSADSSGYFVISGTMPNYNVYIKPNVVTKYNLYLGGRIVADSFEHYDSFGDVANYYVKNAAGTTTLLTGRNDTTNTAASAVNSGTSVTLTYTFKTDSWDRSSFYSFIGWYKGDASGPDYANGKISTKNPFTFIPKGNTYIYAVGTRDVYINGSKNITGATTDWNTKNGVDQNFMMSFDPDYVNPEGGAIGRYYWEVKPEWFNASGTGGVGNYTMGSYQGDGTPYWNNNSNPGTNSFFQIRDEATGGNKSIWTGIEPYVSTKDYIKFGKIDPRDYNDHSAANADGLGTIKFKESDYKGYTAPITIYYYPGHGFSVEPTPMFSNLYVSNGFDVGGTSRNTATTVTVPTGETSFTITSKGTGWDPDHEGHVQYYIPEKKNAKVRITKTCTANEEVVAFDIYDIDNDTFYSRTDVTAGASNAYYIDLQCTMQQNLYIVPVIQEKSADLTINFDGTQLNKAQWGEIVTAYAWYSDGSSTHALGAYPGQPMVVSDDGNTWTAAIPSQRTISGTKYTLAGILFTNYVDGNHSWLGLSGIMGTVTYGGAGTEASPTTVSIADDGIIKQYNYIESGDNKEYSRANFKAQTYDYREPVAIYANESHEQGVKTTITFAMKDGDSSLISWRHTDLINANVVTETNPKWKLRFEYLTNSTGKKYSDLNGQPLEGTPTATYYIAAKGQVIYKNDSMTDVYYSGKKKDTPSPAVSYGLSGTSINFNYAVQWYVYDAQGNYITNVLSAAFADQKDGMSYIAKQLDDLGYAVDGKSVAICYDKPRYMFTDDGGVINSGTNFDAYRFEGQWYATVQTEPVTVSVGVGMMTENGEVIADTNHPGYGDATAAYSTTYGTAAYAHSSDGDKSVTVALADASKRLVKLDATATNFVGWYYYDANTKEFTKASYKNANDFYPNFNADVTYYAVYEAKAVYQYNYTGREGAKTYSVAGGALTDAEMTDGNKVATTRTDFGSKSPGASDVSVFKKNISFNTTVTTGMLNNTTPYIMNINNATITDASYTVTAHYRNASGSLITKAKTATYNTPVNFTSENSGTSLPSVYAGHKFLGWFECDSNGANIGNLLSTQANYGMVVVKNQHIIAVYENDGSGKTVSDSDVFTLFADDHEVTREKYSASTGTYYNDTIIRLRNDSTGNLTSLPSGAEVGILVINANDSGQSTVVSDQANLTNFATNLTNGQTAAVGSKGRTVTKVSSTTLNTFGRIDLAMRCDYGTVNGTAYSVYAYYKNPSGAYTFVTVREGGIYTID